MLLVAATEWLAPPPAFTGLLQSSSSLSASRLASPMNFSRDGLRLMAFFRIWVQRFILVG